MGQFFFCQPISKFEQQQRAYGLGRTLVKANATGVVIMHFIQNETPEPSFLMCVKYQTGIIRVIIRVRFTP